MSKDSREPEDLWRRRDFVSRVGWWALGASGLGFAGSFFRLLYRRAPIEPPTVFKAGRIEDYAVGVSERWVKSWRVFIVRDEERLYAVYAKCSHLGCTPRWYRHRLRFKCPCHGSGFTTEGINVEGPAPRPLDRVEVWVHRDGELRVDVGRVFPEDSWHLSGASVLLDEGQA
ncbi:MAG TPA: Rieske 2Fe-2S domain-containing protein [Myxococcota bacterium]|nr:Rieske 2Fe-2S domain-containing protein [Myxococcota bacterium]